ncbi:Kalirin-like Protein [Tribolium castaneum]|uniref:Kalirin-like Protein n=3 Tax=Tribolium castaneum TaxID=7070 RepID=D6WFP8_TRICA|nr:Kalirin-like Protein [Tribolium castaneum]
MAPGTQARLITEWPDLSLGEVVTIIRYDTSQGYLVHTQTHSEELWLPAHALSNYNRKPWPFRFKKPAIIPELAPPEFRDSLRDVTVQSGAKIVLKCRVKNCGRSPKISWKKLEPNMCVLRNGRFMLGEEDEGVAMLIIDNVKLSDSGTYSVTISNEGGICQSSALLTVTDPYPALQEPQIQVLSCSSVLLEWESEFYHQFWIEYCQLGTGEWLSPNNNRVINSQRYTVENLIPGETYSFRIIAVQNKLVSLPSVAITLPVADNLKWQQEQFKNRYLELEEISRGRFSIVRRAKDRGTNLEVALKQVTRRRQSHHVTQAEYGLLAGMQHVNVIRAMALFDNAPQPGIDTIVLELVRGPLLFTYLCEKEEYTEATVKTYSRQLMSALLWLHQKDISHLDIKPENVMVDLSGSSPLLKLVDFGDSVNTSKSVILPPACLEFASPELVLGQPVGKHTDCWAAGVFLYVLLSGVSPFLDDSMEETTANILKCDFCFPDDYFAEISPEAKSLVNNLLVLVPSQRINMEECLKSTWMTTDQKTVVIPSSKLKTFMLRRHPMNLPTTPTSPAYFNNEQNVCKT